MSNKCCSDNIFIGQSGSLHRYDLLAILDLFWKYLQYFFILQVLQKIRSVSKKKGYDSNIF